MRDAAVTSNVGVTLRDARLIVFLVALNQDQDGLRCYCLLLGRYGRWGHGVRQEGIYRLRLDGTGLWRTHW